jgi:hypothetical protein
MLKFNGHYVYHTKVKLYRYSKFVTKKKLVGHNVKVRSSLQDLFIIHSCFVPIKNIWLNNLFFLKNKHSYNYYEHTTNIIY